MAREIRPLVVAALLLSMSVVLGCAVRVTSVTPALADRSHGYSWPAPLTYSLLLDPRVGSGWAAEPGEPLPEWALSARSDWKKRVVRACEHAGYSDPAEVDVVGPDGLYHGHVAVAPNGTHLVVAISRGENTFGSGYALLTALTLGVVPTWESWPAWKVTTTFYRGGALEIATTHTVVSRDLAHLVMLPVFWLNFLLPSETDRIEEIIRRCVTGGPGTGVGEDVRSPSSAADRPLRRTSAGDRDPWRGSYAGETLTTTCRCLAGGRTLRPASQRGE